MKPRDPIEWEELVPSLRPSSPAWRAVTRAIWGRVPLTPEELALYLKLSGGRPLPDGGDDDVLVVAGRRSFKTGTAARWGWYEARFAGHEVALEPGQIGLVGVVAPLREQGAELVRYVHGLAALPSEKRHVRKVTADGVELANNIALKIVTADDVAVVSGTWVMGIVDEAARLPGAEAQVPDKAILAALRPALAKVRGAPRRKFVMATSAYIESGIAWSTDVACFAKEDAPTLVLRGSTEKFNPNIDRTWLERERRRDATVAMREYGDGDTPPEWQPAVTESWFGLGVVPGCVDKGRTGSLPHNGTLVFFAVDAAFSADNFGIAGVREEIGPDGKPRLVVVHVDAWKPPPGGALSPRDCVERTIAVMGRYHARSLCLDQYSAPTLIEMFAERGVLATQIPWTGSGVASKAARYRDVREAMRDGNVRLPDDAALIREFSRVRGRLTQSGHESIEAAGKGVDDRVSAVVMACSVARGGAARQQRRERHDRQLDEIGALLVGIAPDEMRARELQQRHDDHARVRDARRRFSQNPEWRKRQFEIDDEALRRAGSPAWSGYAAQAAAEAKARAERDAMTAKVHAAAMARLATKGQ